MASRKQIEYAMLYGASDRTIVDLFMSNSENNDDWGAIVKDAIRRPTPTPTPATTGGMPVGTISTMIAGHSTGVSVMADSVRRETERRNIVDETTQAMVERMAGQVDAGILEMLSSEFVHTSATEPVGLVPTPSYNKTKKAQHQFIKKINPLNEEGMLRTKIAELGALVADQRDRINEQDEEIQHLKELLAGHYTHSRKVRVTR